MSGIQMVVWIPAAVSIISSVRLYLTELKHVLVGLLLAQKEPVL